MKILITGFHHSGTSILRKIIGNHKDVEEITDEVNIHSILDIKDTPGFLVMKAPNLNQHIFEICQKIKNIKIIAILRDPRDCFVSLEERHHGHYAFYGFKKSWIDCVKNSLIVSSLPNGILVKYENLFKNDYEEIKKLFKWIGINYYEEIITKNTERRAPVDCDVVPEKEPPRTQNALFRSYQINQPFKQHSGRYLKLLSRKELDLFQDPEIKKYMLRLGYK